MTEIRYGIIGSGMMGQEHIRNIGLIDGARVTAVCDPDDSMRNQAAALAGDGCKAFTSHARVDGRGVCDALVIAAPNHLHHQVLVDVCRPIFPSWWKSRCAPRVPDCEEILAMAAQRTAPVWVAMEYRYMPPVERLLPATSKGRNRVRFG
jgi:myo-inositol 2-dehydrogenase/D-chiro-inositol 1-dehydrogenase